MKGQSFLVISVFAFAFSTVSEALSIGFDVDTPLDPFLGGLTKFKRQIVRRIKDLSTNDNFLNACPADQLGMLLSQPLTLPPIFPGRPMQLTSQPPMTTQLPFTPFDQRRFGIAQIPPAITQQLDAQLASFTNQLQNQLNRKPQRSSLYPSLFDTRQMSNVMQQLQPPNGQPRFT